MILFKNQTSVEGPKVTDKPFTGTNTTVKVTNLPHTCYRAYPKYSRIV
jgi:hypothetical protein